MKARYLKHIMDLSQHENDEGKDKATDDELTKNHKDTKQRESNDDNNNNNNNKRNKRSRRSNKRKDNKSKSLPPKVVDTFESPPPPMSDDDDVSSESETPVKEDSANNKRNTRRSPLRYFVYALLLWILEFGTALILKRFGIQLEFNETVVQNVFEQQFGRFNETMPAALSYLTQEKKRPGFQLAQEGASHHYPVVLVHGFVTSGLEVWAGKECARQHFRQRFWAALYGARSFLQDRDCWKEHMQLDPYTGGDPPGIRLRAASGFEAVDYFMANCK